MKKFGWATLDSAQQSALKKAVKGERVVDLGCGGGELAVEIARMGAREVLAIDKEEKSYPPTDKVEWAHGYIEDYSRLNDTSTAVVLVSWPVNWAVPGLMPLVDQAKRVVYVGSNVGGSACGTPRLFRSLIHRELLAYVPGEKNSLVVAGRHAREARVPTPEEEAGLASETMVIRRWQDHPPAYARGWEPQKKPAKKGET